MATCVAAVWQHGDDNSLTCSDTLSISATRGQSANPMSLAAARAALHSMKIQTLGTSADYRQAMAAKLIRIDLASGKQRPDHNTADLARIHEYVIEGVVLNRLQSMGIDTAGMTVSGNYRC